MHKFFNEIRPVRSNTSGIRLGASYCRPEGFHAAYEIKHQITVYWEQ